MNAKSIKKKTLNQMKTNWKHLAVITALSLGVAVAALADPPEPPPPPNGHGQNGDAPAGAPIDGGLGILLALGAVYGSRKALLAWRAAKETE